MAAHIYSHAMLRELIAVDYSGRTHTIPTDEHTKLFTFNPAAATVPNTVQIDAATANQLFGADGGGFVSADMVAYGMCQAEQLHGRGRQRQRGHCAIHQQVQAGGGGHVRWRAGCASLPRC